MTKRRKVRGSNPQGLIQPRRFSRALPSPIGLTLFKLTWKEQATPSGRLFFLLRASARRTEGIEPSSWPTPTRQDSASSGSRNYSTESCRHSGTTLTDAARMAVWTTPSARDWKDTGPIKDRADGKARLDQLPRQAYLAAWSTPRENKRGFPDAHGSDERTENSGPQQTGFSAETANGGQLSPEHSRWLMGFPAEWTSCARTETPLPRKSPKRSSALTSKAVAKEIS